MPLAFSYNSSMDNMIKNGKVNLDNLSDFRKPNNGFVGRRVDGSSIVSVDCGDNPDLIALMVDKDDPYSWDKFCDMISDFDPRGQVHIDYLFVDGQPRIFH